MTQYEQRATVEFSKIAGEPVEIRDYEDEATVLCSELGMYRIADRINTKVISKGYSKNLQTWYVTISRGI